MDGKVALIFERWNKQFRTNDTQFIFTRIIQLIQLIQIFIQVLSNQSNKNEAIVEIGIDLINNNDRAEYLRKGKYKFHKIYRISLQEQKQLRHIWKIFFKMKNGPTLQPAASSIATTASNKLFSRFPINFMKRNSRLSSTPLFNHLTTTST